ncbi:MAG: trypsin-like peptidase domain-containing protein [Opitutales bacterium]|nr:trypsin-like peptidase domain-containing protein [Opitutales bacterium]
MQRRVTELFRDNHDAVVKVKAAYQPRNPTELPQVIIGTGFFISREGHVLTNASAVMNNDRVWIVYGGVDYSAKMVGVDRSTNLALLKIITPPQDFPFIQISDDPTLPAPGTMLLRIACPMDLSPSPALGMISGQESRFGQHVFPCILLRTNIPAGPGESGGAYLDLNGRLVGIQVGSLTEINSSYILPARAVMRVRDDLLFYGQVASGWIGFDVTLDTSVAEGARVVINNVIEGTPAQQAGIQIGDQIMQVGIYAVKDLDDLRNALFYTRVGEYIPVKLSRKGQALELTVRIAERPPEADETEAMLPVPEEPVLLNEPKEEAPAQ